jgi:hypothetical protein
LPPLTLKLGYVRVYRDLERQLFYVSNFGEPTSNIITIDASGNASSFFTPNDTIIARGINIGCILKVGDFVYASSYTRYIYKIDSSGNATDFAVLPSNLGTLGMCYTDGFLYAIGQQGSVAGGIYKIDINDGTYEPFITATSEKQYNYIVYNNNIFYVFDRNTQRVKTFNASGGF